MQAFVVVGDKVTLRMAGYDLEEWFIDGVVAEVVSGNPPGARPCQLPTEAFSLRLEGAGAFYRQSAVISVKRQASPEIVHRVQEDYAFHPLPLTA